MIYRKKIREHCWVSIEFSSHVVNSRQIVFSHLFSLLDGTKSNAGSKYFKDFCRWMLTFCFYCFYLTVKKFPKRRERGCYDNLLHRVWLGGEFMWFSIFIYKMTQLLNNDSKEIANNPIAKLLFQSSHANLYTYLKKYIY